MGERSDTAAANEFRGHVGQIIRRKIIREEFGNGPLQIRNRVRSRETLEKAPLIDQLEEIVRNELTIDEKTAIVASELARSLREKFKIPGLAIFIFGLAIHGGIKARSLMGIAPEHDFDWGILSDRKIDQRTLDRINNHGINELEDLSRKHGVRQLIGCSKRNPTQIYSTNLKSREAAAQELTKFSSREGDGGGNLNYFYPSFPQEYNVKNRYLILAALTELSRTNRNLWVKITDALIYGWRRLHRLKPSHLIRISGASDHEFAPARDAVLAGQKMITGMEKIILSTGDLEASTQK